MDWDSFVLGVSDLVSRIKRYWNRTGKMKIGNRGERIAKRYLKKWGMKFLCANFSYENHLGEIDLIFRDKDVLVFVEVKTRVVRNYQKDEEMPLWSRGAMAIDFRKRRNLVRTAESYLCLLRVRKVRWRFDVVEVYLNTSLKVVDIVYSKNVHLLKGY